MSDQQINIIDDILPPDLCQELIFKYKSLDRVDRTNKSMWDANIVDYSTPIFVNDLNNHVNPAFWHNKHICFYRMERILSLNQDITINNVNDDDYYYPLSDVLLFKNYDIPAHPLRNRFINLIETSFSLNENQLNSLLWRGDGVNDIVYDMVYDHSRDDPSPLFLSEASLLHNQTPPPSLDDHNEYAFNMMMRYINEYKRVSTFGS